MIFREVCFQSNLVSKFCHLHNDINQNICTQNIAFSTKTQGCIIVQVKCVQLWQQTKNKNKQMSKTCFQNYCHCSAWNFEIQHFGQRIFMKNLTIKK